MKKKYTLFLTSVITIFEPNFIHKLYSVIHMHKMETQSHKNIIHDNFGMYVLFGTLLIIVGVIVAGSFMFVALASTFLFGMFLLISGIVLVLQSFVSGKWSTFLVHLFGGILLIGSGFLIAMNPSFGLGAFTLLLSLVFLSIGISKMVTSAAEKDAGWGWDFSGGIIIFALGIVIWRFPISSSIGMVGLFLGLGIISTGITELISGITLHKNSTNNNLAI